MDTSEKKFVLYVHPNCEGCKKAVPLLQDSRLKNDVDVQDIRYIPEKMMPNFLVGTPTLVNATTKQIFQGTNVLKMFSDEYMEEGVETVKVNKKENETIQEANHNSKLDKAMTTDHFEQNLDPKMNVEDFMRMRNQLKPKSKQKSFQ